MAEAPEYDYEAPLSHASEDTDWCEQLRRRARVVR